jgi:hypothetical protein
MEDNYQHDVSKAARTSNQVNEKAEPRSQGTQQCDWISELLHGRYSNLIPKDACPTPPHDYKPVPIHIPPVDRGFEKPPVHFPPEHIPPVDRGFEVLPAHDRIIRELPPHFGIEPIDMDPGFSHPSMLETDPDPNMDKTPLAKAIAARIEEFDRTYRPRNEFEL